MDDNDPVNILEQSRKAILNPVLRACCAVKNVAVQLERKLPTEEKLSDARRKGELLKVQIIEIRKLEKQLDNSDVCIATFDGVIDELEDKLDNIGDAAENANYEGNILDSLVPNLRDTLLSKFGIIIPPAVPMTSAVDGNVGFTVGEIPLHNDPQNLRTPPPLSRPFSSSFQSGSSRKPGQRNLFQSASRIPRLSTSACKFSAQKPTNPPVPPIQPCKNVLSSATKQMIMQSSPNLNFQSSTVPSTPLPEHKSAPVPPSSSAKRNLNFMPRGSAVKILSSSKQMASDNAVQKPMEAPTTSVSAGYQQINELNALISRLRNK